MTVIIWQETSPRRFSCAFASHRLDSPEEHRHARMEPMTSERRGKVGTAYGTIQIQLSILNR